MKKHFSRYLFVWCVVFASYPILADELVLYPAPQGAEAAHDFELEVIG